MDPYPPDEYKDPGRPLEVLGIESAGVDFASSGLSCAMASMSWERVDVSLARQCCHAASLSKSSRRPGNDAPALMFLRQV